MDEYETHSVFAKMIRATLASPLFKSGTNPRKISSKLPEPRLGNLDFPDADSGGVRFVMLQCFRQLRPLAFKWT